MAEATEATEATMDDFAREHFVDSLQLGDPLIWLHRARVLGTYEGLTKKRVRIAVFRVLQDEHGRLVKRELRAVSAAWVRVPSAEEARRVRVLASAAAQPDGRLWEAYR